jgi:hypothetical protein
VCSPVRCYSFALNMPLCDFLPFYLLIIYLFNLLIHFFFLSFDSSSICFEYVNLSCHG